VATLRPLFEQIPKAVIILKTNGRKRAFSAAKAVSILNKSHLQKTVGTRKKHDKVSKLKTFIYRGRPASDDTDCRHPALRDQSASATSHSATCPAPLLQNHHHDFRQTPNRIPTGLPGSELIALVALIGLD
jgi:hypothetical protein